MIFASIATWRYNSFFRLPRYCSTLPSNGRGAVTEIKPTLLSMV